MHWVEPRLTPVLRFEKSLCPSDHQTWSAGGSRKRSKPSKKPPRHSWFTFLKTRTCALSMPRELPSCRKTFSWQGGYVVSGEVRVGSEQPRFLVLLRCLLGSLKTNIRCSWWRRSRQVAEPFRYFISTDTEWTVRMLVLVFETWCLHSWPPRPCAGRLPESIFEAGDH